MAKYMKKPVFIDAFQYDGDLINSKGEYYVPEWAVKAYLNGVIHFVKDGQLLIHHITRTYHVAVGDFVIMGSDGGIFALEKADFLETFEPVHVPQCTPQGTCVNCYSGQGSCEALPAFLADLKEISYKHGLIVCATKTSGDSIAVVQMSYEDRDADTSYQEVITGSGFIQF